MVRAAVHRSWYRVALGNGQIIKAAGEHLGQAIAAAEAIGRSHAVAVEATEAAPLGESVGKEAAVITDDRVAPSTFRLSPGALPAITALPRFAPRRGWIERPSELYVIEATTDADHLIDLYLGLVERVPAADNLEVRLLDHFEDAGKTDVWLTSRVNAKKILSFLDDHDEELFGNGHVEFSVYVRSHKATLRLTEHRTVVWIADDRALAADVQRWLKELDVPHADELPTVAGVPHFHYRPAKSRDRKRLGEELYRQRLRRVDTVKRDTAG